MANPVNETIVSWQLDAATADSNLPNAASACGIGDAQDLSGNLRLLKSEMRQVNTTMSWERWKGVKNLAVTNMIFFTYINATTFSVNDNFTGSGNRNVALVGRRMRALWTGGGIFGSIASATYAAPSTTIVGTWDGGFALNATLSEVQFGPEPNSLILTTPQTLINRTGFTIAPGWLVSASDSNDASAVLVDSASTLRPVMVCATGAINGAAAQFIAAGLAPVVLVANTTTRGHYLVSAGAGNASASDSGVPQSSGFPPLGAFGVALSNGIAGGGVPVFLFGTTVTLPNLLSTANGYGRRFVSAGAVDGTQMNPGDIWLQYGLGALALANLIGGMFV